MGQIWKTAGPARKLNFQPFWNWASTCKPSLMLFLTSLDIQDGCVETEGSSTFPSCYQTSRGPLSPHTYVMQSLSTDANRLLDQRSLESVGHPAQGHLKSPTAILYPGFSIGLGLLTGSSASGCLGQSVLSPCSWASQPPSTTLRQLEPPLQGFWNGSRQLSAASGLRTLPGYPA